MNKIAATETLASLSSHTIVEQSDVILLLGGKDKGSPVSITPPQSEWSSLNINETEKNPKKALYKAGLFSQGSGEICYKYIAQSDSEILQNLYYNYPKVHDPGIKAALHKPEPQVTYSEDGQELYIACCQEMRHAPVRIFQKNILTPVIDLKYYGIRKNHFRAMAKALTRNRIVKHLNISENFLSIDDCYHIGELLYYNTTLSELIMAGCRIGPHGLLRMKAGLEASSKLKKLDLSRNQLEDEGGELFAQHIIEGGSTPDVNLSNNALGTATAKRLEKAFAVRNEMTNLDLSRNNFFEQVPVAKMISSLATNKVLTIVNLAWNGLRGAAVAKSIGKLLLCPSLQELDLSNNQLSSDMIATPIATNLPLSKRIKRLSLSCNPINRTGAKLILETMLNPKVKLETLLLDDIIVDNKFFECLEIIKTMESRKSFTVTYGGDVDIKKRPSQVDPKKVIVSRADFLCRSSKKKMDFALYIFQLEKEFHDKINANDFAKRVLSDRAPLDEDLISGLIEAFPVASEAQTSNKKESQEALNLTALVEFIHRMWPQKKLPPEIPRRSLARNKNKSRKKSKEVKK